MKFELGKEYVDRVSGEVVIVVGFRYTDDRIFVEHRYYNSKNTYEIDSVQFKKEFKEREILILNDKGITIRGKKVEVNTKKDSVNSDILKLIEAGYEFKSFFGDTLDGRSISLDLNEEEK